MYPKHLNTRLHRSYSWNLFCHILPVLLISTLINIPKFLESSVRWTPDSETYIAVTELRMDKWYVVIYQNWIRCTTNIYNGIMHNRYIYNVIARLVFLGVVPLLLLIFLNIRVFFAINRRKSSSRDRNYSTILLLIVVIFIICHTPRSASSLSALLLQHNTSNLLIAISPDTA